MHAHRRTRGPAVLLRRYNCLGNRGSSADGDHVYQYRMAYVRGHRHRDIREFSGHRHRDARDHQPIGQGRRRSLGRGGSCHRWLLCGGFLLSDRSATIRGGAADRHEQQQANLLN